jgi:hypothetical protein
MSGAKKWIATAMLAMCGIGSTGCFTQAVMGANSPEALVLLPVAMTFDLIGLAAAGAARSNLRSPPGGPPPNYANLGFQDPDDWVGECAGPLWCDEHEQFVCEGRPGDCDCWCEVTPAPAFDDCVMASPLAANQCVDPRLAKR